MLKVPDVEPGDIGLVLAVGGLMHDAATGHWWLLCVGNRPYRIPVELNDWAARTDAAVRRRFLNLPKVFGFASVNNEFHVQLL